VTRLLSGAALVVIAVALVWFAPPTVFLVAGLALAALAFVEYVSLARAVGIDLPAWPVGVSVVATAGALSRTLVPVAPALALEAVLMSSAVAIAALVLPRWRGGSDALPLSAASLLPILYLGLPVGALIAVRETQGPQGLFLLMLTVMVSDTAQYYTGRLFGRTPLAPAISPKKTIEGAIGGFVFGTLLLAVVGRWWLPGISWTLRAVLGAAIVALGIAGDLFESMLKRSAGVKDSSALIPGHGGVLDRIDALLFAAPIYYVVLKYV
jgi:phosphatidate cytidylyltransferase